MRAKYLYHITLSKNVPTIKQLGLIPSIGKRRTRCTSDFERLSNDPRISLCDIDGLKKWRESIYKKETDNNISILKIDISNLKIKKRTWAQGLEYGCWDIISMKNIVEIKNYFDLKK